MAREHVIGSWMVKRMKSIARIVLFGCLILFLPAGCTTTAHLYKKDLLGFIEDGTTSKEEVLQRLGVPSFRFEGERILTYKIGGSEEKGHCVIGGNKWKGVKYSLVLVFDEEGILRKHSLVEVR